MNAFTIRAVLFEREPGHWVAQCLEHDIGAQAKNLPDLTYRLQRSLVGYAAICAERGLELFSDLPPAPQEYHVMWESAHVRVHPDETMAFPMTQERQIVPELKVAA